MPRGPIHYSATLTRNSSATPYSPATPDERTSSTCARTPASVAERESPQPRSVLGTEVGNRVRALERHLHHGVSLGDRIVMHPTRRGRRIARGEGMGLLRVDLVSHPGQQGSRPDFDVLVAGMRVRRELVAVRHETSMVV